MHGETCVSGPSFLESFTRYWLKRVALVTPACSVHLTAVAVHALSCLPPSALVMLHGYNAALSRSALAILKRVVRAERKHHVFNIS